MVLSLGSYSYCHTYKESGDLDEKQTIVGNFMGINSMLINGYASYGHNICEISTFLFG